MTKSAQSLGVDMGYVVRKRRTGAYVLYPEPHIGGIAASGVGMARSMPGFEFAECDFSPGNTPRAVYVALRNSERRTRPFIFQVGEGACTFVPWRNKTCPKPMFDAVRRRSAPVFRELMAAFALAKFMLE